ncbi:MAG: ribose-phosphate pyrophosphokinase [Clostridia bacterium]|nr:ribose-phosphate pyrophosphokinase [Clostridia bacterium]
MRVNNSSEGDLGLILLQGSNGFGKLVDEDLVFKRRGEKKTYVIKINDVRFANGEGKVVLQETVRGKDIFILADVGNYSCTYNMFGYENRMGPDEHFQSIKRTISAIGGNARRINVIMPLLYAGRQDKRKGRESLDCAVALQELKALGVDNIITVDAHEPRVENAIPLIGFENLYPTFDMLSSIIMNKNTKIEGDTSSIKIISPDTGAMDRALYYAQAIGVDIGVFYKRRDYTKVVNGKNPIVEHAYMGGPLEGCNLLIVDDMLSSGDSILDIANQARERNAGDVYVAVTFAFFTEGTEKFDKAYEDGLIKRIYSSNLSYIPENIKQRPWFVQVDMSDMISEVIDRLNYDISLTEMFNVTNRLKELEQFIRMTNEQ